jgi:hypothetical protein
MLPVAEVPVPWVSRESRPRQVKQPASRCLLLRWAVSLLLLRFEASSPIGVHIEEYKAGRYPFRKLRRPIQTTYRPAQFVFAAITIVTLMYHHPRVVPREVSLAFILVVSALFRICVPTLVAARRSGQRICSCLKSVIRIPPNDRDRISDSADFSPQRRFCACARSCSGPVHTNRPANHMTVDQAISCL